MAGEVEYTIFQPFVKAPKQSIRYNDIRLQMSNRSVTTPTSPSTRSVPALPPYLNLHLFFWGLLASLVGVILSFIGTICHMLESVSVLHDALQPVEDISLWSAGLLAFIGILLVAVEIVLILPLRRRLPRLSEGDGFTASSITVALTAYNDEDSIGLAVRDFLAHPLVKRVIVVSNNSTDNTYEEARLAGAIVYNELKPGYGQCVYRCLQEGLSFLDTDSVALCEGDMTFRARDLSKLVTYLPHAEIVNGTRIVEQLRAYQTQLSTFMYYGNFFVGKLLEAKHFGRGTFTDVGTTYKILRRTALEKLLVHLNPQINLEFNAHFLDTALQYSHLLVECPVTFHARIGKSKGGNVNNLRATKVGLRMIRGLIFGWGSVR